MSIPNINVMALYRRGRRCKQLLDDPNEKIILEIMLNVNLMQQAILLIYS